MKNERDLKRLRRSELIEVIYQLKKNEEMLEERIKTLEAELQDKSIKIEKAGSIADAAMSLSGIFSTAQRVADIYLEEIQRRYKAVEAIYVPQDKTKNEAIEPNTSSDTGAGKSDRLRKFSGNDAENKFGGNQEDKSQSGTSLARQCFRKKEKDGYR